MKKILVKFPSPRMRSIASSMIPVDRAMCSYSQDAGKGGTFAVTAEQLKALKVCRADRGRRRPFRFSVVSRPDDFLPCHRTSSSAKQPSALGHPADDVEAIIDYAEREIRHGRTCLHLRQGAEMLYLALASSLERMAKRPITTPRARRDVLGRLGKQRPEMPRAFAQMKRKLQRECFHQRICPRPDLVKAVATARKFVGSLPPKLPRQSPAADAASGSLRTWPRATSRPWRTTGFPRHR